MQINRTDSYVNVFYENRDLQINQTESYEAVTILVTISSDAVMDCVDRYFWDY